MSCRHRCIIVRKKSDRSREHISIKNCVLKMKNESEKRRITKVLAQSGIKQDTETALCPLNDHETCQCPCYKPVEPIVFM